MHKHIQMKDAICTECKQPAIGDEPGRCVHCRNVPRPERSRGIQFSNNAAATDAEKSTANAVHT